jgi:hypothetical protein
VAAVLLTTLVGPLLSGPVLAADPTFEQILATRRVQTVLEQDGHVMTGLDGGGVLVWNSTGTVVDQWTAGDELSGNDVRAMAWTGRHLWVTTLGAGLTRVQDPAGSPVFRQYATNIAGLDVLSVTGRLVGSSERVYYGTSGDGLGLITDGLSSAVYTAEQDGLISDTVNDVHFFGDDLFIATPAGISKFAGNFFTDEVAGLTDLDVRDLHLDPDGNLIAGGRGGVFRWDLGTGTWSPVLAMDKDVTRITTFEGSVFALDVNSILYVEDGQSWTALDHGQYDCSALFGGTELWIGGDSRQSNGHGFLHHAYVGRWLAGDEFDFHLSLASQVYNGMGVTFEQDDNPVLGDFRGLYVSWAEGDEWVNIYETPHAENDTLTLHPGRGNVLAMTTGADGMVYAGQFAGGGVLRIDTEARRTELISPDNSGLNGRRVIGLVSHPDGPIIVLHDSNDPELVDVLVDPDDWGNSGAWLTLTSDEVGPGTAAADVLVERADVMWFAILGVGLVRWDVNGDNAGPDDPLTWFDPSDDRWDPPITDFPKSPLDPRDANSLALGDQGTLWAGGNGLVQFLYDAEVDTLGTYNSLTEKRSSGSTGLVDGNVVDIVGARDGIWVATRTGLNRVVSRKKNEVEVDAWIDLRNYVGNPDYQSIYSPSVIAPLPGLTYQRITVNDDRSLLLVASDQGVTMVRAGPAIGTGDEGGTDPLASVYCYPNPWSPDDDSAGLRIAGLPEGVNSDNKAEAVLYNLEGQPVWRGSHGDSDSEWKFWKGQNKFGEYAAQTGLYVLKVSWNGSHTLRTVALVR